MSLTISAPTYPEGFLPSGNDIIFTALSTSAYQSGFAYLIDVYVNGNAVIQLRQSPITPSQAIRINVKNIVSNYISSIFPASLWTLSVAPEIAQVYIGVTEYYGGQPYDTANSVPVTIWNSAAQWNDMKKGVDRFIRNFTPYTGGSVHTDGRMLAYHNTCSISPFITNGPGIGGFTTVRIDTNSIPKYQTNYNIPHYISMFTKFGLGVTNPFAPYVVIAGFDSTGLMIKKYVYATNVDSSLNKTIFTQDIRIYPTMSATYRYKRFTELDLDTMDDCAYFMVYPCYTFNGNCTVADTPTLYPVCFEINRCKESFAILYKSSDGGWGQIQMNNKTQNEVNVETTTKLDTIPTTWTNQSRLISTIDIKAQGQWILNTGWIENGMFADIEDLIISPQIYLIHQPDSSVNDATKIEYIPVQLSNNTYVVKETKAVNLRNYELTFTESFYKNTIRQ